MSGFLPLFDMPWDPEPSSEERMHRFREHRQDFEQLAAIVREDARIGQGPWRSRTLRLEEADLRGPYQLFPVPPVSQSGKYRRPCLLLTALRPLSAP